MAYLSCTISDSSSPKSRPEMANWKNILEGRKVELPPRWARKMTPVEIHGGYLVKRDDLFEIAGIRGGKVRSCWHLAEGAKGLVTSGSRQSPQINIVAQIAKQKGIPCRAHTALGTLSEELKDAKKAGAKIIQHYNGFSNVLACRARLDATKRGWTEIPFGMMCWEAIDETRYQVRNLPFGQFKRIVISSGSGMSLAGVLWGLKDMEKSVQVIFAKAKGQMVGLPKVLGVKSGARSERQLDKFGPPDWKKMVDLVPSGLVYHRSAPETMLGDLKLDPIYEAKCLPFLKKGDLFWVVGIRRTV